jgi:hypothetical protein
LFVSLVYYTESVKKILGTGFITLPPRFWNQYECDTTVRNRTILGLTFRIMGYPFEQVRITKGNLNENNTLFKIEIR